MAIVLLITTVWLCGIAALVAMCRAAASGDRHMRAQLGAERLRRVALHEFALRA
jgi:hypothetical protein